MKLKYYLESFRLRTLPLSISGILLGVCVAMSRGFYKPYLFLFALLTTLSLQILSNISNELGDLEKGTDNDQRLGPIRAAQRGVLTKANLTNSMLVFGFLSIVFGLTLVYLAYGNFYSLNSSIMLMMGFCAVMASIKYTFGKKNYGYLGLGDLFVFIFFGLVSVLGVYFLAVGHIPLRLLLPATAIGLLCTGVLNVNNMRDVENDAAFKKKTMAVRIGQRNIKYYHAFLVVTPFLLMGKYAILINNGLIGFIYLWSVPFFVFHLIKVFKQNGKDLDPQLKVLSLSTLLFSLLSGLGTIF